MKEHNNPGQAESAWIKPVLTVLVRNNPEEGVLTACKGWVVAAGPLSLVGGCSRDCEGRYDNLTTS